MTSSFTRHAVAELIEKAVALGVQVPAEVYGIANGCGGTTGAVHYANLHPEQSAADPTGVPDALLGCCYGAANRGVAYCTCWDPVFDVEQAVPVPGPVETRASLCGDCAYRKGSPERAEAYTEESLLALPERGQPFWCHDGMRRPRVYRHPSGLEVPGDPADWQPAILGGSLPFRADGRPGLLCAGWSARANRSDRAKAATP